MIKLNEEHKRKISVSNKLLNSKKTNFLSTTNTIELPIIPLPKGYVQRTALEMITGEINATVA